MDKNIIVVGCGFVGLSNAFLLSVRNNVVAIDKDERKIKDLKKKKLVFNDNLMECFISRKDLNLNFDMEYREHLANSDYLIIATPTDYNPETNSFNTKSVDGILEDLSNINYGGMIVIKSTIPIGYTERMSNLHPNLKIMFSPEFLRETTALEDNLKPDRIIVSGNLELHKKLIEDFGRLLKEQACNAPDLIVTHPSEAEAIKLFSNTYLAMRVAFFNELDTFSMKNKLSSKNIIEGVCKDKRIGEFYNNPSFGYGGYCLPKDTKQLLHNYENVPNELIQAIVKSNKTRKNSIAEDIASKLEINKSIGIYRLVMKDGSDNFRASSILGVIRRLQDLGYKIYIYEPELKSETYLNCKVENKLEVFKQVSDLVVCNRVTDDVCNIPEKIYSRDVFHIDT